MVSGSDNNPLISDNTSVLACAAEYDCDELMFRLVDRHAQSNPGGTAVVYQDIKWTYRELFEYSNGLAAYLSEMLDGRQNTVLVYLPRSQYISLAMLSIMKSGNIYLPLNQKTPPSRVEYIMEDAGVSCVITTSECRDMFSGGRASVVCLDDYDLEKHALDSYGAAVDLGDVAYVIYTSGSTGYPKGVVLQHRGLTNQMLGWQEFTPAYPNLSGTAIASFGFDNSIWEQFFTLAWGGELHVISEKVITNPRLLATYLSDNEIVSTNIPPALLEGVLNVYESGDVPFALSRLVAGGDSVTSAVYQRYKRLNPELELVVGYGPTEASITASVYRFEDNASISSANVPIGKPLPGYRVYLLDDDHEHVVRGETGEIHIAGNGVLAREYLNRPELTSGCFVADPFVENERMYKTGDLARIDSDGNLVFLGRKDFQVKIRGKRVELAEVEANIQSVADASNVVCAVVGDGASAVLCAYLEGAERSKEEIRSILAERLEPHMVPAAYVMMEKMTLNLNNKVDRKVLPKPTADDFVKGDYVPAENPMQLFICDAWSEILGIERIGVLDNFEWLGGNSIQYVTFMAKVSSEFGCDMEVLEDMMRTDITVEQVESELKKVLPAMA